MPEDGGGGCAEVAIGLLFLAESAAAAIVE
jgi:hypothetical protein